MATLLAERIYRLRLRLAELDLPADEIHDEHCALMLLDGWPEEAQFPTGSRIYGVPREDSDFDIVVRCDAERVPELVASGFREVFRSGAGACLRRGPQNAIVCFTGTEFERWREARQLCLDTAPIDRDTAVRIHRDRNIGGYERDTTPAPELALA